MRSTSPALRRPGFTLIEVIVAAGLCMLIMAVLAGAFAAGIDTFSLLKSTGELNDRLTLAKDVMVGDLSQTILEDDTGLPLRVSDVRYDILGTPLAQDPVLGRYAKPPARGFFRIIQEGVSTGEGVDPDGIPSSFATGHILHLSVRRSPDQPSKAFLARVPHALAPNPTGNPGPVNNTASNAIDAWTSDSKNGTTGAMTQTAEYPAPTPATTGRRIGDFGYRLQHECLGSLSGVQLPVAPSDRPAPAVDRSFGSPWAEVAYFLRPTGTFTIATPSSPARQLFSFHRRLRLLTKNDQAQTQLGWTAFQAAAPGMSCAPGTKALNGPGDIANPFNRMGGLLGTRSALATGANIDTIGPAADANGNMTGEDILLTNVISFEIKASWNDQLDTRFPYHVGVGGLSTFTNPGNLTAVGPRYNLPVRPVGAGEFVPGAPATPIVLATADTPVSEAPFDDLPLAPSVERGWAPTDSAMQTHSFPNGSGNAPANAGNNFARWFMDGTYTANTRRVFDTWSALANWNQAVVPDASTPRMWQPNPNYVPLPIRLKAVQIKLRIYDPKNRLTRQITFIQDL